MTMPAFAEEIGSRLPSQMEMDAANQLRKILASQSDGETRLRLLEARNEVPTEVVLTPHMSRLLMEMLRHIGRGDAVTLVPIGQMLTTQQAADILNVSRPYLVGVIEGGAIPFSTVGRHRRIKAEDLFEYKRIRDGERAAALEDMARLDAEHGLL